MTVATRSAVRRRRVRVLPPDPSRAARPLDRLVLDGRRLDMQIGDRLLSAQLARAIPINVLTLGLQNADRALFRTVLGQRIMTREARLELDGLAYIATGFSKDGDTVSVPFEDEVITILKRHGKDKPWSVSRGTMTRGAACATMIRQAGVPVIVLDEQVIQPIAGARKLKDELAKARREAAAKNRKASRTSAKGITGRGLTVKGQPASAGQRRTLSAVLAECARQGCATDVRVAAVCAAIQETGAGTLKHVTTGNDDTGTFQQGRNWISLANVYDDAKACRAFLLGHKADVGGNDPSVKGWKGEFGSVTRMPPGGIEAAIVQVQRGGAGAGAWEAEARRWVQAAGDDVVGSTEGQASAYLKDVRFERRKGESTYQACVRELSEVKWTIFAREGVVIIASEPALMRGPSARTLTEYKGGTENIDFEGHRGLRVGELTAKAIVGRYELDPGEPVDIDGLPPLQRHWLLASVTQDLMSPMTPADLGARRPQQPGDEPASTVETTPGSSSSSRPGAAGSLKAACQEISRKQVVYSWGGGHARVGHLDGPRHGVDCSGAVCWALALTDMGFTLGKPGTNSTGLESWGQAGRSADGTVYANAGHTFIQGNGWRFDTGGPGATDGPRFRTEERSTAGFVARRWSS